MSTVGQFTGGRPLRRTTYTSGSGTHTFLTTAVRIRAYLMSGGGGGGKPDGTGPATNGAGWGGGGGAYDIIELDTASVGATIAYAVGAGGVGKITTPGAGAAGGGTKLGTRIVPGGGGGSNGRVTASGVSTSVDVINGAVPNAVGNAFGRPSTAATISSPLYVPSWSGGDGGYTPAAGGAGNGGLAAGTKHAVVSESGPTVTLLTPTQTLSSGGNASAYDGGGGGGSSMLGTGGNGGNGHSTTPTAGDVGTGYGGGGGGGGGSGGGVNTGGDGGNGSAGRIVIEEY